MDNDDVMAGIAAAVRAALADPAVRAEVAELLTGATDARRRRLKALAQEVASYDLSWQRRPEEHEDEP
jgi:hypothetical protein